MLALVVILLLVGGATAQSTDATAKRDREKNTCTTVWNGCNKCTGDGSNKVCKECEDKNTIIVDKKKCVCDSSKGYGIITQEQWVQCKRSGNGNKNGQGPNNQKPKGCFKCKECDLFAQDGECKSRPTSPTKGRRLFYSDEDIWV